MSTDNETDSPGETELLRQRILDLEARNRVLELLASTDELTGLLNRRAFLSRMNEEIQRCVRYGRCVALLYIDLDGLKSINDTHGHAEGDFTLRLVADTMRGALRQSDVIARLGGDEFAVILPDTELQGAANAAERIRSAINIEVETAKSLGYRLTASIGAAVYSQETNSAEKLMLAADGMLYSAKAEGGNRICEQQ